MNVHNVYTNFKSEKCIMKPEQLQIDLVLFHA